MPLQRTCCSSASTWFQATLPLLFCSLAISPPHMRALSFCLFYQLLLHLPLTDRLSHMQTLQTCAFSKRSLEESSRETLNKSSYQQRFPCTFHLLVCLHLCFLSSPANIFIPFLLLCFCSLSLLGFASPNSFTCDFSSVDLVAPSSSHTPHCFPLPLPVFDRWGDSFKSLYSFFSPALGPSKTTMAQEVTQK